MRRHKRRERAEGTVYYIHPDFCNTPQEKDMTINPWNGKPMYLIGVRIVTKRRKGFCFSCDSNRMERQTEHRN